jgi:hypothetical protein
MDLAVLINIYKYIMRIAYLLLGRLGRNEYKYLTREEFDKTKVKNLMSVKIMYNHFKKHVIDVNKNSNIDTFLYTNDIIVKDELLNYFKPLDYIINNDTDNIVPKEELKNSGTMDHMYFLSKQISETLKLVKKKNIDYDMIYIDRLDMVHLTDLNFDKYNKSFIYSGKYPPFATKFNDNIEDNKQKIISSWFLFGGYNHIIRLIDIYVWLKKNFKNFKNKNWGIHEFYYHFFYDINHLIKLTRYMGKDYCKVNLLYFVKEWYPKYAKFSSSWKNWIDGGFNPKLEYLNNNYNS